MRYFRSRITEVLFRTEDEETTQINYSGAWIDTTYTIEEFLNKKKFTEISEADLFLEKL